MTPNELDKILKDHKKWLNNEDEGHRADLRGADLRDANLRGAYIDYSCWPLWCGSLDVKVDRRIFCQLAYHLCRVIVDDDDCKEAQLMLGRLANEFHRADECGRVPEPPRWISVEDRLPERKGVYLVAYHPCHWDNILPETEVSIDTFRGGKSMSNKAWARNKYQRVTHWMPLPMPPKGE